jgi:hypothetical protein
MKKIKMIAVVAPILLPIFFIILIVFSVASLSDEKEDESGGTDNSTSIGVSPEVLAYKTLIEKYAKIEGISDKVNILMAIMMVESGGKGTDPMQSSESLGLPVNTLTPEASIKQGVAHFKGALDDAKEQGNDEWTAVASYNFGRAYNSYVGRNGKKHTIDIAEKYSRDVVAPSLGNTTGIKYSYVNEVSQKFGKPYLYLNGGNFFYAELVRQYVGTSVNIEGDEFFKSVMKEALKYEGYPYVFGGTAPNAFDCSSLTQWTYSVSGVNIPRTAQAQYDSMKHIDLKSAKPGDLVFFHSTYVTSDYVTHVGIFVGDNKMFHAGDPLGYADLTNQYWQDHIIGFGTVR